MHVLAIVMMIRVELSAKMTPTFLLPPELLKEIVPESETHLCEVSSANRTRQDTAIVVKGVAQIVNIVEILTSGWTTW